MTEKSTSSLNGPELLKFFEDNWQTEMGAWFPGERVVLRGKDVFSELNECSWMEYLVYAVTGKESPKLAKVIEGLWLLSTSFPDPRLWNNRVAALAGSARSTGALAISAGVAISEATVYALKPIKGALDFLYRASEKKDNGATIENIVKEELKTYRNVSGYGRPLTNADERIKPVFAFLESMESNRGKFVQLAFEIEEYFKSTRYKYRINIAALNAATAADFGLTASEYYHMTTMAFTAGMFPCYIDAKNQLEGTFFPLKVERANSKSFTARKWA
jgi:5-hydroxyisourate hydrolase-like protein (transthyretin family)